MIVFIPKSVRPGPCSSFGFFYHIPLFVYCFKLLILYIQCFDKCHNSDFNALIKEVSSLVFFRFFCNYKSLKVTQLLIGLTVRLANQKLCYIQQSKISERKLIAWLIVLWFNATFIAKVIMAVGDAHVFPGFLTPALTQLFFPNPPTTYLTCFCRGERRKFASTGDRTHES